MVKKKKAAGKKKTKPFPTQFESDFRALLTGPNPVHGKPPVRLWPPPGQLAPQSFTDITAVMNLLANAWATATPPVAAAGNDIVSRTQTLASNSSWPTNAVYQSRLYKWWTGSIHLYEISRVVVAMLQARNRGPEAAGGGGSPWPPSK
jgi:hypothetical protein